MGIKPTRKGRRSSMEILLLALAVQILIATAAWIFAPLQRVATTLGLVACLTLCVLGLGPALHGLTEGPPHPIQFGWDKAHGTFRVGMDALSAFFLVPLFLLSALAAIYGASYLAGHAKSKSLGSLWFFFNLFIAAMVLVLISRTAFLFLMAWEAMSVSAYFLVTFEHEKESVRKAGWVYLIATHLGTACLLFAFLLVRRNAQSLEFEAFRVAVPSSPAWSGLIFVLVLVGFGAKAGFVPFHVWLPEAHPAAPSHVSALMSGVMIKLGLYGLLRFLTFLGPPAAWWGIAMVCLGLLSALVAIAQAMYQREVKRILAYSSIENIGLIGVAMGVGLWGRASDLPAIGLLGMTAGLLHIWNHALMKGLMFFGAGSILHASGTDDVEKLGGLMHTLPWTACAMMTGSVAIAALPPLNGFVSKWLTYMALFKFGLITEGNQSLALFFGAGLLALVGGMTAMTFVRLAGIILLGSPRNDAARHIHKSSIWMIAPMLFLALLCALVAVAPLGTLRLLVAPLQQILGQPTDRIVSMLDSPQVPLSRVGSFNLGCLLVAALGAAGYWAFSRRTALTAGPTWGCGYLAPDARMQYTGRSFAEMLSDRLLPPALQPRSTMPAIQGFFPPQTTFDTAYVDPVTERVYEPFFLRWARRFARLRILQQGKIHVYLVYILLTVVAALGWISLRTWWPAS